MEQFFSAARPEIAIGGKDHFLYLFIIIILFILLVSFRHQLKAHKKAVMLTTLILALLQRGLSFTYFIYIREYTLAESLPLHICRLVCLLIIFQFFLRKDWLDQLIFFWGLFAYGSFIYPIEISPLTHVMGVTFVLLHSLNLLFPLVRYFTVGFIPSFKGSIIASVAFAIYLPTVAVFNAWAGGNYFYLVERPFFYTMAELPYFFINLIGVCLAFLTIGIIFQFIAKTVTSH
ncbi:TIGR02206 family membrane protein [Tetragenococcus solitarius]|uniref:YwaF family protein n=1 Tax=Tetragenococcus solitarius TaxID=71453 RepID=UPI0008396B95|nr:TIGR02206 family membrane protein [Tetragenococcus solitarius]